MRTSGRMLLAMGLLQGLSSMSFGQWSARDMPPGKWWKTLQLAQELKLTKEQQARIESFWVQQRNNLIDQKAVLDKLQLALSNLLSQNTVNEADALKAFEQVQAARSATERITFSMRVRIKNILNPEQQRKLEEISERVRRNRGLTRTTPIHPATEGKLPKRGESNTAPRPPITPPPPE